MVSIQLAEKEVELLHDILESYFQDLRGEITHTDQFDFREFLKTKEALIRRLMDDLKAAMPKNG